MVSTCSWILNPYLFIWYQVLRDLVSPMFILSYFHFCTFLYLESRLSTYIWNIPIPVACNPPKSLQMEVFPSFNLLVLVCSLGILLHLVLSHYLVSLSDQCVP